MMHLRPIELNPENISGIAGSISIACWVIVFVPQIYENFYRRSSDGLSLLFVVLWLAGDVFNLLGAMMQHLLTTMIVLAAYYTIADVVLLGQCLWYDSEEKIDPVHLSPANPLNENVLQDIFNENEPLLLSNGQANIIQNNEDRSSSNLDEIIENEDAEEIIKQNYLSDSSVVFIVILAGFISWYVTYCHTSHTNPPEKTLPLKTNWLAQLFGYLSAFLYLGSRIPQILLNYKRKSCEGISFLFFLFACLGNITFIISVLTISMDIKYLILNLSWLLGSSGTLVLDFIIFVQFFAYGKGIRVYRKRKNGQNSSSVSNNSTV
ncbi:hypothetical protein KAFR_0C01360 [Kazachstania africana CBS 2517]|uniref:PQ-loop repeat-containing protein n=1 Tax=Kazachstania africana (strain ATCC 22294 / BCRC 22015 / CBS 2517 / CECT 1963 / NBRC 1671 / NRRL Y-8276) TaxID=1071382 RepID=H2ARX9_KAZAF|nr:hypothetical protein KAFR_0C01360 [Kazachstania africana CBS 2517]CCF57129.1 hypothetical protein KAFR_0C01360 [Kazachstania africana CBS 2517]